MTEPADRMFIGLPAVFRRGDDTGDLTCLLGVLAGFFFTGSTIDNHELPGLERYLEQIPGLFSPVGTDSSLVQSHTPERFLHWLASWLSFSPHALFSTERLRHIVAGIVPMYGLRGTKNYLVRLLELCFGQEIARIQVDDRPKVGFTVGESALGIDTRLAVSRPFFFKVVIERHEVPAEPVARHDAETLQHRLRAVIDFAKPAHTTYELEWGSPQRRTRRRDGPAKSVEGTVEAQHHGSAPRGSTSC
jgi:phage tail-like protein